MNETIFTKVHSDLGVLIEFIGWQCHRRHDQRHLAKSAGQKEPGPLERA